MDQQRYLEHVRGLLRGSTAVLQGMAIVIWLISMLVNPLIERIHLPSTAALVLALVGICIWKSLTQHVRGWRAGTFLYACVLATAFRLELEQMSSQADLLATPVLILLTLGFAAIMALHRDYLASLAVIWAAFLLGDSPVLRMPVAPQLLGLMLVGVLLVGLVLNHGILRYLVRAYQLQERFRELAETDSLTGLPNRRALIAHLERVCLQGRDDCHLALVDLDDFKSINDAHGHGVGDAVLVALAAQMRRLPCGSYAGRLGGEEFGIVLCQATREAAHDAVQRLLDAVRALDVEGVRFAFSVGLVPVNQGASLAQLLSMADRALYQAKQQGKGRLVWAQSPG